MMTPGTIAPESENWLACGGWLSEQWLSEGNSGSEQCRTAAAAWEFILVLTILGGLHCNSWYSLAALAVRFVLFSFIG